MRPAIWIPEEAPDTERGRLAELAELHVYPAAGELPPALGPGDLLVAGHHPRRALEVAPRIEGLRYVQTFSAGVDRIVGRLPAGVVLCDAAGVHDIAVAEWVVMVILAARRRLPEHVDGQRSGTWRRETLIGDDLDGATVALVGVGAIGRAVEARLLPFGVRIVRVARRARAGVHPIEELATILSAADIVVILMPLTPGTNGLFGAVAIDAMRPGALLVNASRGKIVDTSALTAAVLDGRIRVALDVTDPEPLPEGHPLWSAPGALITPHVASDVRAEDNRAWALVHAQVGRLARGEPLANEVVDGY
jgi:phosphoglycerate dehydrogenase-like enzyme